MGKSWHQAEKNQVNLEKSERCSVGNWEKVDDKYPGTTTTTTDSVEEETLPPIVEMSTRDTT